MRDLLSPTAENNLYTMGVAAQKDPRQRVPASPTTRDVATRLCRARLVLEEAIETCHALGFAVMIPMEPNSVGEPGYIRVTDMTGIDMEPCKEPNLEDIIDGCCDTIYVAVGTLLAVGVPDLPHLAEVNRCNAAKFPGGKAITDANGKYQKPEGWKGPNHYNVMGRTIQETEFTLIDVQGEIIKETAGRVLPVRPAPVEKPPRTKQLGKSMGQVAYEAVAAHQERSMQELSMPEWEELNEDVKKIWHGAGNAVAWACGVELTSPQQ